jgi:hypothetical protein
VLSAVLKPEDPRWIDFIEEVPADLERPEPVEDLEAESGTPGHVILRWEPSERAESYDVEVQDAEQNAEFRWAATARDPVADLSLTPGSKVKVRVIARNATGASAPSEIVEVQVPVAVAA